MPPIICCAGVLKKDILKLISYESKSKSDRSSDRCNPNDDKIDDIAKDWQLPRYELVKKVLDELKKEE